MVSAGDRSSDSGLPLRRLPGRGQWRRGEGLLPSQRRDRPGFAPGSLSARRCSAAPYHRAVAASRLVTTWLPVALWAGLIFGLSSVPHLGTGLGTWDLVLRKLAHATEYAVLGALLSRALGREPLAFGIGVAYAASDEFHQHFVRGRHASPVDVAIDAAGVLLGILAWQRLRSFRWAR